MSGITWRICFFSLFQKVVDIRGNEKQASHGLPMKEKFLRFFGWKNE
jgi:hypothetical protein